MENSEPKKTGLGTTLLTLGGGLAGGIMDILNQRKQLQQQKDLNKFNQELQLDTWRKTSYPAQREMMEKAGLNPGLMYGMGGGGGQSIGTQGSNVPQTQGTFTGMGLQLQSQLALQKAQKENIEADTENKKAEIPVKGAEVPLKTAQEDEIRAKIPTYGKLIEKTDKEIEKIASDLGINTQTLLNLKAQELKTNEETNKLQIENHILNNSKESLIRLNKLQTTGQELQNELNKVQIGKTTTETTAIKNSIQQEWKKLEQQAEQLVINWKNSNNTQRSNELTEMKNKIEKFKAEITANYPGIMNTMGKTVDDGIKALYNILGIDEINQRKIK